MVLDRYTLWKWRFFRGAYQPLLEQMDWANVFGKATNVDTNVATDIWDRANPEDDQAIWLAPLSPLVHTVVSDDANDGGGGSGARLVTIKGLDSGFNEITEQITLNGTSGVQTVNQYIRINSFRCDEFGSGDINAGEITATAQINNTVTAQICAGLGNALMAIYTIPDNTTGYMTQFYGTIDRTTGAPTKALITLLARKNAGTLTSGFVVENNLVVQFDGNTDVPRRFEPFKRFPAKTDIKLQCTASSNNTSVSAGFDVILIKD